MVWGGISTKGVTQLKRVEGIMDKKMYHSILVYRAIPEGKRLLGKGFVFQEDNDPKHSSNYCRNYLATKEKSGFVDFTYYTLAAINSSTCVFLGLICDSIIFTNISGTSRILR